MIKISLKKLTINDSNKFGHKNKIGDFKYIDIKDLVNNIKDNIISEIDAKKRLNTLNIINSQINHKRLISGQKELLNLFDDLSDIIPTDKTLMSLKDENEKLKEEKTLNVNEIENENEENENENEKLNENENKDEDDDDIMKILIHSNDYDEEAMDQNKKN